MHTPIMQFGTSRFLQAHADLFISEAMERGEAIGGVTVVQTTLSGERSRRLQALPAPEGFPVHIRGKQDGEIVDRITMVRSVKRALSANHEWQSTEGVFTDEARVVICNTADTGYDVSGESSALPVGIPSSFPGKLTLLLLRRFEKNGHPLTILPAELIADNGDVLASIVLRLSEQWALPDAFRDWLRSQVIFTNTLVDRIVSAPLEPAGAVAEPYALWAIQNRPGLVLPCAHPAIIVADDISHFANLKLFILNLGHTFLADRWLASDLPRDLSVRELLSIEASREQLLFLYNNEILPGFVARNLGDEAARYIAETVERFENPYLDHRLQDIAQNHQEKIRRRAGGFLSWSGVQAPVLERLLATAG